MLQRIRTLSFGEELIQDYTVCIRCICDGHDINSCGWIFKSAYGELPIPNDICFLPYAQKPLTSIMRPFNIDEIKSCKNLIIGSTYKPFKGTVTGIRGAKILLSMTITVD